VVVAHLLPPCVVAALACRPTVFQVEACAAVRKRDATEVRQSFKEYRVALNEFGLTPASKARVATGGPKRSKDPADQFFDCIAGCGWVPPGGLGLVGAAGMRRDPHSLPPRGDTSPITDEPESKRSLP
jgi:hypothetical protein